jgi:hypothetical protein
MSRVVGRKVPKSIALGKSSLEAGIWKLESGHQKTEKREDIVENGSPSQGNWS